MAQVSILVVDDEEPVRRVVASLLDRAGYQVTTAGSAAQALEALREAGGFDLLLSDVMMPGTDGLSLLDRVAEDFPTTPVVMFTAVHDIHVATNAFRRGAIDYLLKPFVRAQLEAVVERGLEHGRLRRQTALYRQNLEEAVQERTARLRQTMVELERSYDITIEAMGGALDLRDEETEGHSRRVTAYTVAMAREVGMQAEELKTISRGAFLHDIGKIATPDAILLKPGRLDADETVIMRQHCAQGYEMVRKIPFLEEAAEIVLAHQECYDGSGYPRGLKGEEIPLGARIFAIADTLDAITSDRPYRKGASFEAAREEIARWSGRQFDPALVTVFLAMPLKRWADLRASIEKRADAPLSLAALHLDFGPMASNG
ncbi:HDIG domain-containing protein [Granulicella pectinivorans]|uniref:HDIG domain-containing protein n=2 Tax=Granulicella pectinivorans TaxID=474950 RepID=A0A1I6MGE6_9BACT|nr:HDIG domain-containing protein [Granulicella pectinivorans]